MAHILVAGRLHQAGLDELDAAEGITYKLIDEISLASYAPHVGDAEAILLRTQPMTAEVVAASPKLRIVSRHGVGYDAVDVAALNARRIPLAVVGDVNSRAVAEHTLMLMLAAARRAVAHDRAVRDGQWNVRNTFETVELDGKHLLIVGLGRIGRRVAELAKAFGMTVAAFDPFVSAEAMQALGIAHCGHLEAGLSAADYATLHMPGTGQGPLIGARELAATKRGAILVNAARGGLIDEQALDLSLRSGHLRGAALDVFSEEPPAAGHALFSNPRVTLSPHSAGLTAECAARMAVASVRNILDLLAGRLDPALVVNAEAIGFQR